MSAQPTKPAELPNHGELLNALLDIKGAVQISRQAVYNTMSRVTLEDHPEDSADTLQAAEGTLTLAGAAIERLYEQIEAAGKMWPEPIEEVTNG